MKYTLALLFVLSLCPAACAQHPGNPDAFGVDVYNDWSWNAVHSGGVWSTLDPSLPARLYYRFDYAAPIASMFASLAFDTNLPAGGPTSFLVADASLDGLEFKNFHTCSAAMSACTNDFFDITPLVAGVETAYLRITFQGNAQFSGGILYTALVPEPSAFVGLGLLVTTLGAGYRRTRG